MKEACAMAIALLAALTVVTCGDDFSPGPGSGGAASLGGGGTGGGGIDPGCVPSEASEPVAETCGVFVSSSLGNDDTGDGTKDAPYATITKAESDDKNIYACAETFDEAVELMSGQSLFGGLDCADGWNYTGEKTEINGPANAITLKIGGGGDYRVEDCAVTAHRRGRGRQLDRRAG